MTQMLKSFNNIVEGSAHVFAIAMALLLICGVIGGAGGCRVVSYRSPDGTRAFGASVLTDPKGSFSSERTQGGATTQRTSIDYESKSNAGEAIELLRAIK